MGRAGLRCSIAKGTLTWAPREAGGPLLLLMPTPFWLLLLNCSRAATGAAYIQFAATYGHERITT